MCHRIQPLLLSELLEALEALRASGRARVPMREPDIVVPDAYPGTMLPLFIPTQQGGLDARELT